MMICIVKLYKWGIGGGGDFMFWYDIKLFKENVI